MLIDLRDNALVEIVNLLGCNVTADGHGAKLFEGSRKALPRDGRSLLVTGDLSRLL